MKITKTYFYVISPLILASLVLCLFSQTTHANKNITIRLKVTKCPWADLNLGVRLDYYLSTIDNVPIETIEFAVDEITEIKPTPDFNELLLEGMNQDCDFLVDISIDRIDLERRRTVFLPQILSRNRVFAVLNGSFRIIDIKNQRLIKLKNFTYEVKAKDRWHLIDDDANDSDLTIPPDKKKVLFMELEDKAASGLFEEISTLVHGDNFENQ